MLFQLQELFNFRWALFLSVLVHLGVLLPMAWKKHGRLVAIGQPSPTVLVDVITKESLLSQKSVEIKNEQKQTFLQKKAPDQRTLEPKVETAVETAKSFLAQREASIQGDKSGEAQYPDELRAYIDSHKVYPTQARRLRQSGVVKIRLQIAPDGRFTQVVLVEPTDFSAINQAALKLVSDLHAFKPLPAGLSGSGEFLIPIEYRLEGVE